VSGNEATALDFLDEQRELKESTTRLGGRALIYAFFILSALPGVIALWRDSDPGFGARVDALHLSVVAIMVLALLLLVRLILSLLSLRRDYGLLKRRNEEAIDAAEILAAKLRKIR
jgi:hypothetical protein